MPSSLLQSPRERACCRDFLRKAHQHTPRPRAPRAAAASPSNRSDVAVTTSRSAQDSLHREAATTGKHHVDGESPRARLLLLHGHPSAVFANIGAAYGTAKSGVGIASMGVMNPGLVMRNIIPVVMAGVLGIYGLIVAVILQGSISKPEEANGAFTTKFSSFSGYAYLSAGLCCGLSGLAAGMAIGVVGDAGVRAVGQQEKLFVGMFLILIFAGRWDCRVIVAHPGAVAECRGGGWSSPC